MDGILKSVYYAMSRFKERDRSRRHETDDNERFFLLRKKDPCTDRIF